VTDSTLGFGTLWFHGQLMLKGQQPRQGKWQSCSAVEGPSPLLGTSFITGYPVWGMLEWCCKRSNSSFRWMKRQGWRWQTKKWGDAQGIRQCADSAA
jgi:hypothetical protein